MVELKGITKVYRMGKVEVPALKGVDLSIQGGEMVAIIGASGSGKSTLMNIIGCLDKPTSGQYFLEGIDVGRLNDDSLAVLRNKKIGFVFQQYNLLPRINALANVELPLVYSGVIQKRKRAVDALERVGLGKRIHHKPTEMSGGEQQRVAIARALINNPSLILADEPTGNLDTLASAEIMGIFHKLHLDGMTVVLVTHETDIAQQAHRIIRVMDGRVVSDQKIAGTVTHAT
ncbi:MAG: ABC-type antimicrobial peptide transport system,ATPase component [Chloroflexi bacterium]|nr:ABC-type antimicrobial peptide transport system,ATPase component [Chloroflexota bacterium]